MAEIEATQEITDAVNLLIENGYVVYQPKQEIIDQIELLKEYYPPADKNEATKTISATHFRTLLEESCCEIAIKKLTSYLKLCGYIPTGTPDGIEFLIK